MKVWILEQDISRGENLGRMVKRFLENAGAGSRITMYQRPVEVVSALKQHKGKPAVLFINPDAFDMKYSGLNLAHKIFEKKMDISLVLVSESIGYAYDGYAFCAEGYVCYGKNLQEQLNHILKRLYYRYSMEVERLEFFVKRQCVQMPLLKISHIESDNHYSVIHTDYGRSYRSYVSLSTLYEQLADRENFIMVGKSYVINTIHIKMFTKEEVALHENVSIPVPVRLQKMIYETLTTQMS